MLNSVVLIGRFTRDPELRFTPSGVAKTSFNLAVERSFKNAQGEKETDFVDCIVWRKQAESVANNTVKGSLVGVEGSLQIRSYDDKEGVRRKVAEINCSNVKFLDFKKKEQQEANNKEDNKEDKGAEIPDWTNGEEAPF